MTTVPQAPLESDRPDAPMVAHAPPSGIAAHAASVPLAPAGPQIPGAPPADERVGTVLADRVCTKCYFNLVSQPVIRERHYGLLVIRCPECGTLASVQEYPHLSRWSRRVIAIFVMAWFAFLLLSLMASGFVMQSASESLVTLASEPGAQKLAEAHLEFQKRKAELQYPQPAQQPNNWYVNQQASVWSYIDPLFIEMYDAGAFFEQAGGWSAIWGRRLYVQWALGALASAIIGMCWSVVLPHAKRWKRLLVVGPILGAAWVMGLLDSPSTAWMPAGGWQYANYLVQSQISTTVEVLATATFAVPLVLGVYLGRGVARLGARMLLPPKFREPVHFLWLADGYKPPRPRGA